ncbi:FAD:protein FMN transferase [Clostridium sp. OS1-26]|uniref:FAD:protein FMN transferase n=1 Tax=Clostridium sp. OS1-26 TaxID=3070681 RepID=UPI0027E0137D|nr:FAD:protein FMN transferase [Clostridium sp. OS1-26]WML37012.1 FAD:protein FMN transferase [Clostridium sp. OS1-26]
MSGKIGNKDLIVSNEFYILGTTNILKAYGEKADIAIIEAMKKLLDIDNKMSVFKGTSEFSLINNHAGESAVAVSDDTYYVIKKSMQYAQMSNGAFNPTIRPVVELWNIGRNNSQVPKEESIKEKLQLVNYRDIILNDEKNSIKLAHKQQRIDGGAIVKGFAADKVKEILIKNGVESAMIDLGGNIYAMGVNAGADMPWRIGIQNPLGIRDEFVGVLSIVDKSIVTSGDYERYFIKDNKKYHHIIDPRTGYPCNNGVISATIVSDSSLDADALCTCIYVMGVEEGMKLVDSMEGVDAIIITDDKKIHVSSGIKENFILTNLDFKIED